MAEVFLAVPAGKSTEPPPPVALKRIRPELSRHKAFLKRFTDEAKICALLRHPNIVEIFELGAVGTDLYFTMEWVNGKGLDVLLTKLREKGQALPLDVAAYIGLRVAEALDYAHGLRDSAGRDLKIVHCDVTPGNVLLRYDGEVKLTDFGMATVERSVTGREQAPTLGKLPYMSPEQLKGEGTDRRSDIYSLGVLLYELWTLKRPFESAQALELQQRILDSVPALEFPPVLKNSASELVRRCLAKDRKDRPQSVADLRSSLTCDAVSARENLKRWMADLFQKEIPQEREEARNGLTVWSERKIEKLEPEEDSFVRDLLSENDPGDSLERTEFLPVSQAGQSTHITFVEEDGADLSGISFVQNFSATPDAPSRETTDPDPSEAGLQNGSGPKSFAKIGVIRKSVERPIQKPLPVTEVPAVSSPGESDEVIQLATESSHPRPDPMLSRPVVHEQRTSSISPYTETTLRRHRPNLKRVRPFIVSAVAGLASIAILWGALHPGGKKRPHVPHVPPMAWKMNVFISAESQSPDVDQRALLSWTNPALRSQHWIKPLREFFEREYVRRTGQKDVPLSWIVEDSVHDLSHVEWKPSLLHPGRPFGDLKSNFNLENETLRRGQGFLFIHLYAKNFWETPRYPVDFREKRPQGIGLVFVPLSPKEDEESLVRIAHELLHVLGASDKYSGAGAPEFPEGFVEPDQTPRYPQNWGEIMSRSIPLAEDNYRPLKSLREAAIGDVTAEEIGW